MKVKNLYKKAKELNKAIVFPEAGFSDRTIEAIKIIKKKKIARPILIGDESAIVLRDKTLIDYQIINPKTFQNRDELVKILLEKRKDKGLTRDEAERLVDDPYYFGTLLVEKGYADGMVAGAEAPTATTIRPALQIIKSKRKMGIVSSCFIMTGTNKFLNGKWLVLADCGLNIKPNEEELYQIACQSTETYRNLGLANPKVAFLSFSSKGSGQDDNLNKIRVACAKFKKSGTICDGELQFDAAMSESVAKIKCPESPIKGDANILIFPDLNSGNICYKAMQYMGGVQAIGPILQGLKKPVNDLSRGCSIDDIISVTAITALQCQNEK